ncbi:MAG: glycosyltransferase family 1 protein [Clostridia bacterium]|nr:glycosyltransferase family 1 protein [Clostridia bacterium]
MSHEPKRILHVVTYMGRGGIETMLMNYYRHIDRTKLQFDFLVHRDFRADFDDEIEAMGGRIYRMPPMNPLKRSYWKALDVFFRSHPYEIVHCHLNYKSGIVLAAARRTGVPIRIAHAHTASMSAGWSKLARILMKPMIPFTATHYMACSRNAGNAIFGKKSTMLLPNALDAATLRFDVQIRGQMRRALGLEQAYTLMHVGRFGSEKNHTFLLDAFAEVLKQEPDAKLLLAGDGELRAAMEERAAGLPEGAVRFLGVRSDVPELMQAADVFVFPSLFEGLPVTMIEAQAAGLPCIKSASVTDECIVTDLVESLPADNPKAWADAILDRKNTPRTDRVDEIRAHGYDITTAAEKLSRFYLNGEAL